MSKLGLSVLATTLCVTTLWAAEDTDTFTFPGAASTPSAAPGFNLPAKPTDKSQPLSSSQFKSAVTSESQKNQRENYQKSQDALKQLNQYNSASSTIPPLPKMNTPGATSAPASKNAPTVDQQQNSLGTPSQTSPSYTPPTQLAPNPPVPAPSPDRAEPPTQPQQQPYSGFAPSTPSNNTQDTNSQSGSGWNIRY